jgi:ubiquinone/menaquinone biosynthesis C-methylase UbiE
MQPQLIRIRDQQRDTWDKFSAGWKQWDDLVMDWIAPVGEELIRGARLRDTSHVLDVAAGTGEPGLSVAARVPKGKVTVTDLSSRMLEVAAENAARRGITNFETRQCDAGEMPFPEGSFVVAGLAKAEQSAREKIRLTVLDLARQTSTDGRVRFHWSAVAISGEK